MIRAKEQAEENEIRLKIAQRASKAGTWDWDIVNNTFYWSDEFLNIFRMPKDTIAGFEAWTRALHPDDVEKASKNIRESIENRTELINDYRIILPDQEIRSPMNGILGFAGLLKNHECHAGTFQRNT